MTRAEAKRRKRARRAFRQYRRVAEGPRDEIGYPEPGLCRRMVAKWLNRNDREAWKPLTFEQIRKLAARTR